MSNWHSMEIDQVIKELNTDPRKGLSGEEANNRIGKYGYNELNRKNLLQPSFWSRSNILIILLVMVAFFSVFVPLIFRI